MKQISVQEVLEQLKSDKSDWPLYDFDENVRNQLYFWSDVL